MEERRIKSGISGTHLLSSNSRTVIEKNAEIIGSGEIEDYIADDSIFIDTCNNEFGRSMFYARGAENIELLGEENSVINGRGRNWKNAVDFYRRPSLLRMVDCKNVKIKNITLIDSACWAIHLHNCENVEIENVTIISKWCCNNDGIDLDCCRNVTVKNCRVETEDDAIVLKATKNILSKNIVIENCELKTEGSGFKIGTESVGDFENITYRNNLIKRSNGCAIKIVPTDGASVRGLTVENVQCEWVTGPIFIANGERMRTYYDGETRETYGKISDVTIRKVNGIVYAREDMPAAQGKGCVFVSGTRRNPIKQVKIEDCEFQMPGGETAGKEYPVGEMGAQYPEYYSLGTVPAYGVYLRNIDGAVYQDVKISLAKADIRKEVVMENVKI